jgi:glycosyltransferase involved in cell wall biosynthesis
VKKTIIHIIDSLGRGGAEIMLVELQKDLSESYDIVLVTLNNILDFEPDEFKYKKKYCLNYHSLKDLPLAVLRLKKIIRMHKPALIRTDLFLSTIIGRLSCPENIPLIFCVHSIISKDAFDKNRLALYTEKLTYKERHVLLAVSEAVLNDYKKNIPIKGKSFVLNNFINNNFFNQKYSFKINSQGKINLIAVGNLKEAKNYEFLLETIQQIKGKVAVTLDIIGEGELATKLQKMIDKNDLPVKLLGKKLNIYKLLPWYTAFIMCSHHEGFGNAPAEAMAIGLPLILNDTTSMKEMSKGNAFYFESNSHKSLGQLLMSLKDRKEELLLFSEKGKIIANKDYTKEKYLDRLLDIYKEVIAN